MNLANLQDVIHHETIFHDAFKASPIGIAVEDFDGRPLFVNPALCSMLGFSEEEMRSRQCIEFSPAEDAKKDWALFEKLKAGTIKGYQIEKRFIRRDGSLIWGYLSISLLNNPSSPLVVAMVEDISDRRTAQEERAAIVEASDDAIISQSVQGVIRSWNGGAQRMFGYTDNEAIGESIEIIIPSDLHSEEADISRRLSLGEWVQHYETLRVRKDKRKISVSITASALKDASGAIIGISKVVRNITECKLAEEALSSISRKLMEAHEEERTRIARELHDDINQRIALVAMQLQRMQQAISSSAPELQQQIADAHEQLSDVTKDVQSLSHRLHSSKLEYLGLVGASKSFLAEASERGRVEIQFHSQDVPKTISQEVAVCLFRVLQEAVHNAIKHSCSRDIRVSLTTGEEAVELEVVDLGSGFDIDEAMKGRGLGLISMKERLRLVGGDFSIRSRSKEGTTIHVRVPRTQQ